MGNNICLLKILPKNLFADENWMNEMYLETFNNECVLKILPRLLEPS